MNWKISLALIALSAITGVFAQEREYDITVSNQTPVTFLLLSKTCNGGIIVSPPNKIPPAPEIIKFSVQSDAGVGCVLRYNDQKGSILGIWIHDHQVTCSDEGGIHSYDCSFRNDLLTIQ